MKKNFDCVQFQRDIREKHWKESGETFEGFMNYIDDKIKTSKLLQELIERKEKERQLTTAS
jgi:hypothetical protein